MAAQGDEATAVANAAGTVSFGSAVVDGMSVGKGSVLLTIRTDRTVDGDPARRAKVAYETAKQEYERAVKLAENRIVSAKELAEAKRDYEQAKLACEAMEARSAGSGRQAVTAPIGGYVKSCLVKEGDYVTVGQPLVSLTQNRRLLLRAEVSERYYKQLGRIRSAHFRTPYDDRVYELEALDGRILSFGKAAGESSFFIPVTFEFDNRGEVIPGSLVEVWLLADEVPEAVVLPKEALTEEQGVFFVYVQVDEEGYRKQEVSVGEENGKEVRILSGIQAGDRVVTKGAFQVKLASVSAAILAHSHEH